MFSAHDWLELGGFLLFGLILLLSGCGNENSPTHEQCARPPYCEDTSQPVYPQQEQRHGKIQNYI